MHLLSSLPKKQKNQGQGQASLPWFSLGWLKYATMQCIYFCTYCDIESHRHLTSENPLSKNKCFGCLWRLRTYSMWIENTLKVIRVSTLSYNFYSTVVKKILQHFTQLTSRTCTRASLASRTFFGGAEVEGNSDGSTRRISRACSAV